MKQFTRMSINRSLYTAGDFGYDTFWFYGNEPTHLHLGDDLLPATENIDIYELVRENDNGDHEYAYVTDGSAASLTPMTEEELISLLEELTEELSEEE